MIGSLATAFGMLGGCGSATEEKPAPSKTTENAEENTKTIQKNKSQSDVPSLEDLFAPSVKKKTGNSSVPKGTQRNFVLKEYTERYPNGQFKMRVMLKQYSDDTKVFHGDYTEWYSDGKKNKEGVYHEGKMEGHWKFWFKNGNLAKQGEYSADLAEGMWTYNRPDGSVKSTGQFEKGIKVGSWKKYDKEGKVIGPNKETEEQ